MFRIFRIASLVSRTNASRYATDSSLSPILLQHNLSSPAFIRHYSNGSQKPPSDDDRDCKLRPPICKPKSKDDCKPGEECTKKTIPYLEQCKKPNILTECPAPECLHDEKKTGRGLWLLALLAAAATAAAVYWLFFADKDEEKKITTKSLKPTKKLKKPFVVEKCPENSRDIPDDVPYLIIGGGTAAFAAFRAIKSNDPAAQVLVISNEEEYPYMRPPLSKELWYSDDPKATENLDFKQWNGTQRSLFYEPKDFYLDTKDLVASQNGGVAVARGWSVTRLDVMNRKAYLEDGMPIKYEKCLIATGSMPKSLDAIENADANVIDRSTVFRTIYDFKCLQSHLPDAKSVAIIGGGFLGSELACALAHKTKKDPKFKVYQIFKEKAHMETILPEYLSNWTTAKVKSEGVEVHNKSEVVGAFGTPNNVTLALSGGKTVTADLVVVCVGACPNTDIAAASFLEVHPKLGGFLVNTELMARSNLFVAGDAACFYDPQLGRRRIEHHDNAVISGRLAGENMTGAAKPYVHQSMFWSDLGPDVGYEAIGIVDSSLPTVGVFAKVSPEKKKQLEDEKKKEKGDGDKGKDVTKQEVTKSEEPLEKQCLDLANREKEEQERLAKQTATDEKIRLEEEERQKRMKENLPDEDFSKGVVFYLKHDIVVGIVMWNVFNRMSVARQVIADQRKYEDLNEVAKLFNIHED